MTSTVEPSASSSEQVSLAPAAVSLAVPERIAASRLGVSLDVLRRDRRTGKLGIPFIKIGEGKRGLVRYDLADLERWVAEKKRVGRALASQARPPVIEPPTADQQTMPPELPAEQRAPEPDTIEPPAPSRRSPPRTMWEALAEAVQGEPEEDPFATAGRSAPRQGSGYWGH
jgi:hypothetical protein